jgi:hypothetical protein
VSISLNIGFTESLESNNFCVVKLRLAGESIHASMKTHLHIYTVVAAIIGVSANLVIPTHGEISSGNNNASNSEAYGSMNTPNDDSVDFLRQAHNLLTQALMVKIGSEGSANLKNLLVQARGLILQVPPDKAKYQGYRKKALTGLRAVLLDIQNGNANGVLIADRIREADGNLQTAISLGLKANGGPH